jgi:predicted RNA-binding Zn-ribbon protein involved in translation (DUF1610 family)
LRSKGGICFETRSVFSTGGPETVNGGIITGVSQFACPRCGLLSMYRTEVLAKLLATKLGSAPSCPHDHTRLEPFVHPVPEVPLTAPLAKQGKA